MSPDPPSSVERNDNETDDDNNDRLHDDDDGNKAPIKLDPDGAYRYYNNDKYDDIEIPNIHTFAKGGTSSSRRVAVGSTRPFERMATSGTKSSKANSVGSIVAPLTYKPTTKFMEAFGFALRIGVVLGISGILTVLDDEQFQSGLWVYITCCIVSWYPASMDAANVIKKTFHRMLGTILGSTSAVVVGVILLQIDTPEGRARFLSCAFIVISSSFAFIVVYYDKYFGGYSYALMLALLTFGIVVMPFYNTGDVGEDGKDDTWKKGFLRVGNVLLGCVMSIAGSIFIFPKTAHHAIHDGVIKQIEMAGDTSQAVLQAAHDVFSKQTPPIPMYRIIMNQQLKQQHETIYNVGVNGGKNSQLNDNSDDQVHWKYNKAIKSFQSTMSLFPLLQYDPFFNLDKSYEQNMKFRQEMALNLDRSFRIQTTIVLLDSLIRNDRGHSFSTQQLELFEHAGKLIRTMLTMDVTKTDGDDGATTYEEKMHQSETASLELCSILTQLRLEAIKAAKKLEGELSLLTRHSMFNSDPNRFRYDHDHDELDLDDFVLQLESPENGQPLCTKSASLLFLELVEHLILRSLRLYMCNKHQHNQGSRGRIPFRSETRRRNRKNSRGDDAEEGYDDGDDDE